MIDCTCKDPSCRNHPNDFDLSNPPEMIRCDTCKGIMHPYTERNLGGCSCMNPNPNAHYNCNECQDQEGGCASCQPEDKGVYTEAEALADVFYTLEEDGLSAFEFDNDNQLVLYTGLFRHSDGSIHDTKECQCEDDDNAMHPDRECPVHGKWDNDDRCTCETLIADEHPVAENCPVHGE